MTAAALQRAHAYAAAQALSACDFVQSARAARLLRHLTVDEAPVAITDLLNAPDWTLWSAHQRLRRARLVGAAYVAGSLRRCIDGQSLSRAAEAIGEHALDRLLDLPETMTPPTGQDAVVQGGGEALEQTGAAIMLAEFARRPGLSARLRRLLGLAVAGPVDLAAARMAQRAADAVCDDKAPMEDWPVS